MLLRSSNRITEWFTEFYSLLVPGRTETRSSVCFSHLDNLRILRSPDPLDFLGLRSFANTFTALLKVLGHFLP